MTTLWGCCSHRGGGGSASWDCPHCGGRFVHSRNRAALSYTLSLNHLADRTPQELAALRGRRRSGTPNNGLPFPTELYTGIILPESLDWRMYGTCGVRGTPGGFGSERSSPGPVLSPTELPCSPSLH